MTPPLDAKVLAEPPVPLPRELAKLVRPELPSLCDEIGAEIRRTIPEYAQSDRGPYGRALRLGVEQGLATFVEQVASPSTSRDHHDEVFRRLGQFEALEGRSMDSLQAALRVGARVAWRRAMKLGKRYNLSSTIMSAFADTLFAYVDELIALCREGYVEAKSKRAEELDSRRRRLLELILQDPPAPRRAVAELAVAAAWTMPDNVTLVALPADTRCVRTALDGDLLVDFTSNRPHLLIPGPLDDSRRCMLEGALVRTRAAAGLTVPPDHAADSLRWARQALELTTLGIIDDGQVTLSEDHLVTLWLLSDIALVDQLADRQLAIMEDLTDNQRDRLTETLRSWLTTRGTAAQMAEQLHVHPQTVRYRIRKLESILGDQLGDPETRFAIEVVLRAMHLREGIPRWDR